MHERHEYLGQGVGEGYESGWLGSLCVCCRYWYYGGEEYCFGKSYRNRVGKGGGCCGDLEGGQGISFLESLVNFCLL